MMAEHNAEPGRRTDSTTGCVLVTYNSSAWIARCVAALLASSTPPEQIVVVDNASSDATLAALEGFDGRVSVLALDENIGFSRACNLGAARADTDHLLFLNPDTEVDAFAVERAAAVLDSAPSVGAVGGRTLLEDGSINATCCFRDPSLWSVFCRATGLSSLFPHSNVCNPELMGGWSRTDDRDVDVVTGCFLMLRRDLFQSLGGFDERFFMYSEDTDLCRRIRAHHLRCVHKADVVLVHAGGGSDTVRADKLVKVMRAQSQYYDKHWSRVSARIGVVLLDLSVITRLAASLAVGRPEAKQKWRSIWSQRSAWHPTSAWPAPGAAVPPTTPAATEPRLSPSVRIDPAPVETRARMAYRFSRHLARSARSGDLDFVANAGVALGELARLTAIEPFSRSTHECNVCGWSGARFYPNTGPGYHEFDTTCPGCSSLDRHRDLVALLAARTKFFDAGTHIVEVAPDARVRDARAPSARCRLHELRPREARHGTRRHHRDALRDRLGRLLRVPPRSRARPGREGRARRDHAGAPARAAPRCSRCRSTGASRRATSTTRPIHARSATCAATAATSVTDLPGTASS